MSRKPHTPGPWHVGQGNGEGSVFADEGRMRYENGTVLYPICSVIDMDGEGDANANLIAAAPELLAALQMVRNDVSFEHLAGCVIAQVYAAIAKADGGQT